MLNLNNTYFAAADTDTRRPEMVNLSLSAARFGIHIRLLESFPPQHGHNGRADFTTIKIRTAYEKLDVPEDGFVFFSDANDVIFNKGWDSIKPLLEKYYQPGKIAMLRHNKWVSLRGLKDEKSFKVMTDFAEQNGWHHYPTGNMFGKWKDMKELFADMLYFSECMKSGKFDKDIWTKRFFVPEYILDYLSGIEDKTAAYDDETCLFFVQKYERICLMEYNKLVSWKFMNQDAPFIHYCGNNFVMKRQLGAYFNVFEQPEQPVPFARCKHFQLHFPRKKYHEQLPCRGDLGKCAFAGIDRGINWCNPKNCIEYAPLKIDILGASSTAEKMPDCKK